MTLEDAKRVHDGSYLISKFTSPPFKPFRVTRAWMNDRQTVARFRVHALGDIWVDSEGVDFPPSGHEWNQFRQEWVPTNGKASSRKKK